MIDLAYDGQFAEHAYLVLRESDRIRFFDIRGEAGRCWGLSEKERRAGVLVDADEGL
jgi:hypothetical protein